MAGVKVTICGVNTQELPLLSAKEKKERAFIKDKGW